MADVGFYTQANNTSPVEVAGQFGQIANTAQQNKLLQTQNQQSQLDLVNNQVGTIVNGFSSLASKPNLTAQDFFTLGNTLVQQGALDPQVLAAEMENIPQDATPEQLRQMATSYALRAQDAGARFAAQFGTPTMIDTGQTQTPVTVSPLTGIHPIGAPIQNALTPAQVASPQVIGVNANNQPITGTTAQFLEQTGSNPLTGLPQQPAAAPSNALMPADQAAPVQLPAIGPTGGGIVTTPVPGAVAAQEAVGAGSGAQFATDLQQASGFQQNVLPLQKAITALEALGTTGTGPGREQLNEIFSFLQSMGAPGIDPEGIKDFDEARKYLVQYVNQNGNSGTNEKLAAAFAGNPSVDISNAAAIDVAKSALALTRMQNAQVRAFQASGLPENQYSAAVSAWNAEQDPRAYGFDMMTPEARAKLVQGLTPAEKPRFIASLRTAMELGLITPPAQGAPASGQ